MSASAPDALPASAPDALPALTEFDKEYLKLLRQIIQKGTRKPTRQMDSMKIHTLSLTGCQIRVPLPNRSGGLGYCHRMLLEEPRRIRKVCVGVVGFPQLTLKHIAMGVVAEELAAFLRGSTSACELTANKCTIWNDDAAKFAKRKIARGERVIPGDLGPIYGFQWRCHPAGDQIDNAINLLVEDPYSRRNVVSCWDVERLKEMSVPPCHHSFQFVGSPFDLSDTDPDRVVQHVSVDCVVTMRSTDVGLGLPFNVVQYSLLALLCVLDAQVRSNAKHAVGEGRLKYYQLGELVINMADCHIYSTHLDALSLMVDRAAEAPANPLADVPPSYNFNLPNALASVNGFAGATREERKASFVQEWSAPRVKLELHT
jgi:thymidylate synthase